MSFAGHVFDMIQRDKENREMLKYRRNKMKESRHKANAKKTSYPNATISPEMLEKTIKDKKKRELKEERHTLFAKILSLCIVIISLLFILGIGYVKSKK